MEGQTATAGIKEASTDGQREAELNIGIHLTTSSISIQEPIGDAEEWNTGLLAANRQTWRDPTSGH